MFSCSRPFVMLFRTDLGRIQGLRLACAGGRSSYYQKSVLGHHSFPFCDDGANRNNTQENRCTCATALLLLKENHTQPPLASQRLSLLLKICSKIVILIVNLLRFVQRWMVGACGFVRRADCCADPHLHRPIKCGICQPPVQVRPKPVCRGVWSRRRQVCEHACVSSKCMCATVDVACNTSHV